MSSNLKAVIEKIANGVIDEKNMARKVFAKLTKISPPTFKLYDGDLEVSGDFVVTPKYRVFTTKDIGKDFVLEEDLGGQRYFYCYEAANVGQNGIEYSFKGRIDSCRLIGKCPHGEVEVTSGVINDMTHEEGLK